MSKLIPPPRPLPRWLMRVVTAGIAFHFFALGMMVLGAQSGPWWVPPMMIQSTAPPPQFAGVLGESTTRLYLEPMGLANNYHFPSHQTLSPSVQLEIHYSTEQDGPDKIMKFPDPNANPWVRDLQRQLAQAFGNDEQYQANPNPSVRISAPNQKAQMVTFFAPTEPMNPDSELVLSQAESHRLDRMLRDMRVPANTPSSWAMIVAKSISRYMKRQHGAVKVDIVRHSRNPIMPALMFPNPRNPETLTVDDPPYPLKTLVCSFGDGEPKEWHGDELKGAP